MIQAIKPYVSSEDIAKGARWNADIAKELESSNFGIISITKENVNSPWINFEAGALSREIEKSYVTPFLFDLRAADVQGPLAQFQHTANTKDEILKLVADINGRQGDGQLAKEALSAAFGAWWPSLEAQLAKLAKEAAATGPAPPKPDPDAMLAELLEITRATQRESAQRAAMDKSETDMEFENHKIRLEIIEQKINLILHKLSNKSDPWYLSTQSPALSALTNPLSGPLSSLTSETQAGAAPAVPEQPKKKSVFYGNK